MKKLTILSILIMLVSVVSFAQVAPIEAKKVSQFKEGVTLTQVDIAFLNMVANKKIVSASAVVDKSSVKIKNKTFTVAQTLSKQDAAVIKSAVTSFTKVNKGIKKPTKLDKSRDGLCWYWYYYCDYYGYCAYYKYYYICY